MYDSFTAVSFWYSKQDTNEWEKQVNPYHVANLQRMTDIVLAEISGTERLFKATTK